MKFGKVYAFLLVALIFFVMGSACAANETDIGDNVDSSLDNVLGTCDDNEVLSEDIEFSGTTFSELKSEINSADDGDVITLQNDVIQKSSARITISKEITIDGNGYTLNANGRSSIFLVTGNNVVLKNIVFENAKRNGALGGAIEWYGANGTLINCTFVNNVISSKAATTKFSAYGGAVFFNGDGTVINCTFVNNKAESQGYDAFGGAIAFYKGSAINSTVVNCIFVNNTASSDNLRNGFGGAVYFGSTLYVSFNVIVANCSFVNNLAKTSGGAIFIDGENNKNNDELYVVVTNCTFADNKATGTIGSCAGAVYINKAACTVDNSSFVNNTADAYGGAVYFDKAIGTMVNSRFINNTAKSSSGGAVYVGKNSNGAAVDCSFENNTAKSGGAFDADYTRGVVINCTFVNNKATGSSGGAVNFEHGASGEVFNSSFINNKATTSGIGTGGAISGSENVVNCIFENNIADRGGAIYGYGYMDNCTFVNNTATSTNDACGGAVYLSEANSIINNCSFVNNSRSVVYIAKNDCRVVGCRFANNTFCALRCDGDDGHVDDCSFVNNVAADSLGGAVHWRGARGILNNCSFLNNTGSSGGAIYFYGDVNPPKPIYIGAVDSSVVNCSFVNNTADTSGGAISIKANNCVVVNSSFVNNTANKNQGGAIYFVGIQNYGLTGTVVNCSFANNNAKQSFGGAISWPGVRATMVNCIFVNNTAKYGGAVSFLAIPGLSSFRSNVVNCSFTNNAATESGGAVIFYYSANNGRGFVSDSRFANNTAKSGGAISFYSTAINFVNKEITGTVSNCSFDNNSATESGGAVIFYGGKYPMKGFVQDSTFMNNVANFGGAVNFCTSPIQFGYSFAYTRGSVTNSSFVNNTAITSGGAVHFYTSVGEVVDSTFVDNKANHDAGAIYVDAPESLRTVNQNVNPNVLGASVDLKAADVAVIGSSFTDNKANNNGGAVYFTDFYGIVINSSFIDNAVKNYGGAIYSNSTVNISSSNFTGNRAFSGSAWYANDDASIEDSLLLDNKADSMSLILGVVVNDRDVSINSTLAGRDNLLNAIYNNGGDFILRNVTYLGFKGIMNTGNDVVHPVSSADLSDEGILCYQDDREAKQNIVIEIYDSNHNLIYNFTDASDIYGTVYCGLKLAFGEYTVKSYFNENNYYTKIANNTKFSVIPSDVDLVVKKTSNVSTVKIGDLVEWTITVFNDGPGIAFDVNLTEYLSDGLGFVSANPSKGDYRGNIWTIGDMDNGEIQTLKIITKVLKHGQIFNTVSVVTSSNNTNLTNNSTCEITVIDPEKNETEPDNNASQRQNKKEMDNKELINQTATDVDGALIDSNPVGVKYATGNPIFTLLLVLFALVAFRKRSL
ncbi:hypothetical protein [Methanobrevibacter sp.]|uniref:hypothetical protein n=1 Tax=Methanobrevibacter sp. TaxID=66852 RepID=UPI0025FF7AF8|nr:hypothetical protein [Methanobrevibacter sp.]MBR4447147.1 DUF11 domain-containing protein [Methanobrevibacter sp.]